MPRPEADPADVHFEFTPPEKARPLRSRALPFVILGVGILLTLILARFLAELKERENQARFERAAQHVHDAIDDRLNTYISVARSAAALFAAKPEVDETEFRAFVNRLRLERYQPGGRGIGFCQRQPSPSGDTFPVVLIEPRTERNRRFIGVDVFADPPRRVAMERARDQAEAAATHRLNVRPGEGPDVLPAFTVYLPVFLGGSPPASLAERREKLRGFVFAPFRVGDLLNAMFAHDLTPDVDFEIYDGTTITPDTFLYRGGMATTDAAYRRTETLQFAGVTWTLATYSTPEFEATLDRQLGTQVTVTGVVFSLALFGVVFALQLTQERAARSERQIRITLASMADAVIVTDAQGRVTYLNPAAENLSGQTLPKVLGRSVEQVCTVVDARTLRPVEQPVRRVLQTAQPVTTDESVLLADAAGHERPIDVRAAPIRHESGRVLGVAMTVRDITVQRDAELRHRASEARNRAILESALDPIISVDQSGAIVGFNPAAERTFGYRQDEAIGRQFDEALFAPAARDACRRALNRFAPPSADGLGRKRIEVEAIRADGSRFPCELAVSATDIEGQPTLFTAYLHDVTERTESQRKLRAHAAELEMRVAARTRELSETNRQLEALAASIAHDLRGPLRGLQGYSQLLLQDHAEQLDAGGRHYLQRIYDGARFLDRLIVDLLHYGRLSREDLVLGPVPVHDVWQAALFQSQHRLERTHASVTARGPWPRVLAHESTLTQVLANVLSNGLKFVAQGVRPEVTFWTEPRGTMIRLWLQDNGIGIDAPYHEKIFGVFERLNGASYPGTGIGLSLVKKGVERMGGRVGLESSLGRGTRFWIDLPAA